MPLVRIVKNWDWPNLLRQTPGGSGIWNGVEFTLEPVKECDFILFLNNCMEVAIEGICPENQRWMIVQEPYFPGATDWVVEKHQYFFKVYTHFPVDDSGKYVSSQPAIPWYVDKTYDELVSIDIPEKTKSLSWIVGNANDLPGHALRLAFLKHVQKSNLEIDIFGRAVQYIEDKWDGLAPYCYSLAIENNSGPDMWTEKLSDCFLSWTVPVYYGCTNLEKYFPPESFVQIDITKPKACIDQIQQTLSHEDWLARLPYIQKARELILERYQLFPYFAGLVDGVRGEPGPKIHFAIPPYTRSLKARGYRLCNKLTKGFGLPRGLK